MYHIINLYIFTECTFQQIHKIYFPMFSHFGATALAHCTETSIWYKICTSCKTCILYSNHFFDFEYTSTKIKKKRFCKVLDQL